MTTCRSCDAEVVWCLTVSGKRMPVNKRIDSNGNLYMLGGSPVVVVSTTSALGRAIFDFAPEKKTYTSHFATCPNAEKHRR